MNVTDELLMELYDAIRPVVLAQGMNGPAFFMLAMEAAKLGKPLEQITLGEFAGLYDRAGKRFNRIHERLQTLGGGQ